MLRHLKMNLSPTGIAHPIAPFAGAQCFHVVCRVSRGIASWKKREEEGEREERDCTMEREYVTMKDSSTPQLRDITFRYGNCNVRNIDNITRRHRRHE